MNKKITINDLILTLKFFASSSRLPSSVHGMNWLYNVNIVTGSSQRPKNFDKRSFKLQGRIEKSILKIKIPNEVHNNGHSLYFHYASCIELCWAIQKQSPGGVL